MALSSIVSLLPNLGATFAQLGREAESRSGGRYYPGIQLPRTSPAQHGSKLENKSAQFVSLGAKAQERV
jgi:hypothetical protein